MEVLKSDFYDDNIKQKAFQKAYEIVKKIDGKFEYQRRIAVNYLICYVTFCSIYDKENIIQADTDYDIDYNNVSEEEFSQMIDDVKTKKQLRDLYSFYKDSSKNKIIITDKKIWAKWIDKTYSVENNINHFIKLVKDFSFLLSGFWDSENSKNLYFGIAHCLENINTKHQMEECLLENSGYGGFYKLIYVFKEMNDKKTTLQLFNKFYMFCNLLLN